MSNELNTLFQQIKSILNVTEKRYRTDYDSALDISDFAEAQRISAEAQRNILQIRKWRNTIDTLASEIYLANILQVADAAQSNDTIVTTIPAVIEAIKPSPHEDINESTGTKVGVYVRQKMRELSQSGHIFSVNEIEIMQQKHWSNETFGLDYPFIRVYTQSKELSLQIKDDNGYNRYWKEVYQFGNTALLICSQWFSDDRNQFDIWYRGLSNETKKNTPTTQAAVPNEQQDLVERTTTIGSIETEHSGKINTVTSDQASSVAGTKPRLMKLLGKSYDVRNWVDVYVKVCEIMLLHKPYLIAGLDKDAELNTDRRTNFSYIESEIVLNSKRLSNGLWICTNKSADDCVRSSCLILEKCGFPTESLEVELRKD